MLPTMNFGHAGIHPQDRVRRSYEIGLKIMQSRAACELVSFRPDYFVEYLCENTEDVARGLESCPCRRGFTR